VIEIVSDLVGETVVDDVMEEVAHMLICSQNILNSFLALFEVAISCSYLAQSGSGALQQKQNFLVIGPFLAIDPGNG